MEQKRLHLKHLVLIVFGLSILLASLLWLSAWNIAGWLMERQTRGAELSVMELAPGLLQIDATLGGRQIGASSIALLGGQGALLIDAPMTSNLVSRVLEELEGRGAGPERIVITSHSHPDHARGLAFLPPDTRSLASSKTAERLARSVRPFWWLPSVPPLEPESRPSEVVRSGQQVRFADHTLELLLLPPGHTDGDLAVLFPEARVAYVGDLFHGLGGHAAADWENSGGQVEGISGAIDLLLDWLPDGTRLVGGHGGVSQSWSRADLERYQEVQDRLVDAVEAQFEAGATLEETKPAVAEELSDAMLAWSSLARSDSVMHSSDPSGWIENTFRALRDRSVER